MTAITLRLDVSATTAPMPVVLRSLLEVLKRVHGCRCLACQVDEERRPVKYGDRIHQFWERRIRADGDTRWHWSTDGVWSAILATVCICLQ